MEDLGMSLPATPNPAFWAGRRVLLTGHTGFKGAWLALWLHKLGAQVTGLSLASPTNPSLFELTRIAGVVRHHLCDIRNLEAVESVVIAAQPEVVLHLAAQALVRSSYRNPIETYETNVMGTVNVLESLRRVESTRVAIAITTDKVYRNLERPYPYREEDALGGHDPYSASKAAAEMVIDSYSRSFLSESGVAVASARAGNVIGGGDWADDRLIPDAFRAWSQGSVLHVRRPRAARPWQHVLEPLAGYLILAEQLWENPAIAGPYNFGPQTHEAATVRDVVEHARSIFGKGEILWGDGSEGPHEAGWLALEVAKARSVLRVTPRWSLHGALERTMSWYKRFAEGVDAAQLCQSDIVDYERVS